MVNPQDKVSGNECLETGQSARCVKSPIRSRVVAVLPVSEMVLKSKTSLPAPPPHPSRAAHDPTSPAISLTTVMARFTRATHGRRSIGGPHEAGHDEERDAQPHCVLVFKLHLSVMAALTAASIAAMSILPCFIISAVAANAMVMSALVVNSISRRG